MKKRCSQSGADLPSSSPLLDSEKTGRVRLMSGLRVVSLLTLLSRMLGLIRDIGMATLFGNGMVLDAFSVAFRVPNLSRRLFGEGALTTAFLPVFTRELEHSGRPSAWRVASAVMVYLTVVLAGLVLLGELALWAVRGYWQLGEEAELLLGLTAVMLPYLVTICLAAQVSAVLHALGHFTWPALLPVLLNVVWISAIWCIAPAFELATQRIYVVATCIVVAGVLQLFAPLPTLRRLGFQFDFNWRAARGQVAEITKVMLPVIVGLSITQLNTLCDSVIAWTFSPPAVESRHMLMADSASYPLEIGTASALYLGQRMYQFPLGVFGVALGTVLFPLLSRHAERGDLGRLRDDLTLGLRLVLAIGIPASAGLTLLARPLTVLLFRYGEFDANDARQTTEMIAAYAIAVWAYCGLLIVHRGYYAIGDRQTPLRVGLAAVALNLALNLTLIWSIGGRGLALSTAICAILQVLAVVALLPKHVGRLNWQRLLQTLMRVIAVTAIMSTVCYLSVQWLPFTRDFTGRLLHVALPFALSIATYFAAAKLLGLDEVWLILSRPRDITSDSEN